MARYGDLCNLFATEPSEIARKLDVLARHCDREQRDPDQIGRTIVTGTDPLDGIDAFLAEMQAYAAVGIDTVWIGPRGPDPVGWTTDIVERVLPSLSEI